MREIVGETVEVFVDLASSVQGEHSAGGTEVWPQKARKSSDHPTRPLNAITVSLGLEF